MLESTTTTTNQNGETAEQIKYLVPTTIIICLSLFGCVVIIFTYFLFRDLRTTPRKILVFISIGDFFTVSPYLFILWYYFGRMDQMDDNGTYCITQSFISSTAVMWSFMWTSSLSVYLYFFLVKKRTDFAEKLMLPFNIINWGVPLLVNALAQGFRALGGDSRRQNTFNTGGWCWIKNMPNHWETVLWMLVCGKLCEITSYFVNGICYFFVIRKIKGEVKERHLLSGQSIQTAIQGQRKLALAPVLFVLLRIWGTIRFILDCLEIKKKPPDFLVLFHMIGDSSQGFVNFLLFCVFTKKFRENVKMMCDYKNTSTQEEQNSLFTRSNENNISEQKYILKDPGPITFYT